MPASFLSQWWFLSVNSFVQSIIGRRSPDMEFFPRDAGSGGDLDPNIIACATIVAAAAIIAVNLRFWSRRFQRAGLGADDYTIFLALVSTRGFHIAGDGC